MPYKDPEVAKQKAAERRTRGNNREIAKQRSKEWYEKNKKYALERQQTYYIENKDERLAYCRKWEKTESGKVSRAKSNRKMYYKHHDRSLCRDRFKKAIKKGWLVRKPCEVEGCVDVAQGHHEDYSKPYEVRWLCDTHHKEIEGKLL